ncbi:MAG: hypothetical protein BWX81_00707 [Spirochaetes bacterium ADurb.Bin110]|nr:MAG: hypothetical protein BWX81_00707 [Spirochaetes bacterium ADurb.Bin110]
MSDIAPSIIFFEVKEILQNIGVHNERFATARRHPKAYLVELGPCIRAEVKWLQQIGLFPTLAIETGIVALDTLVELCKQLLRFGKISV